MQEPRATNAAFLVDVLLSALRPYEGESVELEVPAIRAPVAEIGQSTALKLCVRRNEHFRWVVFTDFGLESLSRADAISTAVDLLAKVRSVNE